MLPWNLLADKFQFMPEQQNDALFEELDLLFTEDVF